MESVYIETTILSYLASRPSRDLLVAAHQELTREWWQTRRPLFACYVSAVVIEEARAGDVEQAAKRLELTGGMAALELTPAAAGLVRTILQSGVLPSKAARDAAHVAIAAAAGVDYVLTWNCRHLANAQVLRALKTVVMAAGFEMPEVCTPAELMGEEGESGNV